MEITALAKKEHPEYLAKCGGIYSSEWFFSKILHCLRIDTEVFDAAYTWVEHVDYMTALLTGTTAPDKLKRCRCAAGHKAMFNNTWGGYPDKNFLEKLDPKLGKLRDTLSDETYAIDTAAGQLTKEWAEKLGVPVGIPVAMGAFDAHLGAVLSMVLYCRGSSGSKRVNRQSATFSTGLSIISSLADSPQVHMKPLPKKLPRLSPANQAC